jgi:hypothetical protein
MTWALKRQIFYIIILILFISVSGFLIIYPKLNKAPTCSDGIQNGDESGVDCGGSCARACIAEMSNMKVLWARSFKVIPGRYNAVAYIVNHNQNEAVKKINYRFRFADKDNLYIGKREGSTFVPPGGNFVVFEPGIDVGNSIPIYVTFEFTETPDWRQVSQEKIEQLRILISNLELIDDKTYPKLSAIIRNNSLFTIPNVGVVAILYDKDGNAVSASRTYLPRLSPLEISNINFTWPEPFSSDIVEKEIIPMYDIFSVNLE